MSKQLLKSTELETVKRQKRDETNDFVMMWPDNQPKESLFVSKLYNKGFYPEQITIVLTAIDEVCHHCWDNSTNSQRCTCTHDE